MRRKSRELELTLSENGDAVNVDCVLFLKKTQHTVKKTANQKENT